MEQSHVVLRHLHASQLVQKQELVQVFLLHLEPEQFFIREVDSLFVLELSLLLHLQLEQGLHVQLPLRIFESNNSAKQSMLAQKRYDRDIIAPIIPRTAIGTISHKKYEDSFH